MLRSVGGWCDTYTTEENVRAEIQSGISSIPHEDEDKILYYLEKCSLFGVSPGIFHDVFASPETMTFAGTTTDLTDGVWIWPHYLAYYVRKYHYRLPDDFIAHMKMSNWKPRVLSHEELCQLAEQEFEPA